MVRNPAGAPTVASVEEDFDRLDSFMPLMRFCVIALGRFRSTFSVIFLCRGSFLSMRKEVLFN